MLAHLREDVDFVVVTSQLADELRPFVRWLRAPAPRSWGRLTWAVFSLGASLQLRRARADLVHTIVPAPPVRGPVDLASVVFSHSLYHEALGGRRPPDGLPGIWRLARRFSLRLERACYGPGGARALGAQCASGKRSLERLFPGVDVVVVPSMIDTARFRPDAAARDEVRRDHGVAPEETVALFVGRDWELKGLAEAIGGVGEAARIGGRAPRLWIAGRGNVARYEAVAARAGVADAVRFLGYRDEVERLYQAADVLVLPTLCETFCRAAYEAAACGLPVIATPVDGVTDLVGDDECGLLVERDAGSVGRALARLAADPDLRVRLGERGRMRSLEFTVERSAAALLDAYRRLLTEATPAERVAPAGQAVA
jgi:glycosyltransferase involved in cell wall biosynthesis